MAVLGTIVGEPARRATFFSGLHAIGVLAAALWVAAIAITAGTVR